MKYFVRALSSAGIIGSWFMSATVDGKITYQEAVDLIEQLAVVWKVRLNWQVSEIVTSDLSSKIPAELLPDEGDFPAGHL